MHNQKVGLKFRFYSVSNLKLTDHIIVVSLVSTGFPTSVVCYFRVSTFLNLNILEGDKVT